jgi:hypothetical protein
MISQGTILRLFTNVPTCDNVILADVKFEVFFMILSMTRHSLEAVFQSASDFDRKKDHPSVGSHPQYGFLLLIAVERIVQIFVNLIVDGRKP